MRQLAPEVPEALAIAIAACLSRDADSRPRAADVAALLGPPTSASGQLAAVVARRASAWQLTEVPPSRRRRRRGRRMIAAAAWMAVAVGVPVSLWPVWRQPTAKEAKVAAAVAIPPSAEHPGTDDRAAVAETAKAAAGDAPAQQTPLDDPEVQLATAVVPDEPAELMLTADEPIEAGRLELKPGLRVCGRAGARPRIVVSGDGLLVDCENVVFDGVDFVWQQAASGAARRRGQ